MLTPVRLPGLPAGLVTMICIEDVPPEAIDAGVKLFVTVGGLHTFNVAAAALGLLPAVVCNAPAVIVFVAAPAVLLVTSTMIVQPAVEIDVPLAIVKLPAVAVTPVHVPAFPAVPIVMPVGSVSVSALVGVIALAFVLPIVTVRLVLPTLTRSEAPTGY